MRRRAGSRAGFTLLEAMMVVAITGLTLSVLFMAGSRTMLTGMRLGERALSSINNQVSLTAYRDLIQDFVLPPVAIEAEAVATAETVDELGVADDSFVGDPVQVSGWLIAGRDTPCALAGTVGRMTLAAQQTGDLETQVTCQYEGGELGVLMTLRWPGAVFSYSEDGLQWFDSWIVEAGLPVENAYLPNGEMRKVLVRLTALDGRSEVIGLSLSGRSIGAG